jgi:hypothetical protein
MNEPNTIKDPESVLENLTKTLLYEGYSLYPYYRSAVKNQKPIPFGVIFPDEYHVFHEHSNSLMQSQTIICSSDQSTLNITVRFLHLRRTELFQHGNNGEITSVYSLNINGNNYQAGWQTIERKISAENLILSELVNKGMAIPFQFDEKDEREFMFNEEKKIVAKKTICVSAINGSIQIEADKVKDNDKLYRLTVTVINTTNVENAKSISRDEALLQSFLSTHIILQAMQAKFISHQDPPAELKNLIAGCNNWHTWPILIDKNNTTLLSSPIILYDHPEINLQSSGDLFDSTEIEEALLLHVNLLSDEDKKRIGENDEKLLAMLNKVNNMTPEDLAVYHSVMKSSEGAFKK